MEAGKDALLGQGIGKALGGGDIGELLGEGLDLGLLRRPGQQLLQQRMIRGDGHKGDAEDGVGAGGVDRAIVARLRHLEVHLRALRLANPVRLHLADLLRPALEQVQILEQTVGVGRNAEEPLLEVLLLHRAAAADAVTIGRHLLVGQVGAERAPVHRRLLLIGHAQLVGLQEDPLGPLIVIGVAGGNLALPIVAHAPTAHLALHLLNVLNRPLVRVDVELLGRVLRRQPEGVPAHGREDVVAEHLLVARDDIAHNIVAPVAHVHVAAGVGEHRQTIELGLALVVRVAPKGAVLVPILLPLRFNRVKRILFFHKARPSLKTAA